MFQFVNRNGREAALDALLLDVELHRALLNDAADRDDDHEVDEGESHAEPVG